MRRSHPPVLILLAALLLVSCRSSKPAPALVGEPIPPNQCRVVATIVSIDSLVRSYDPKDPCSKAPCIATIRVRKIIGYGAAFPAPLSADDVIAVKFAFTTGPTREVFPEMTEFYSGVRSGSTIEANLVAFGASKGKPGGDPSYTIYGYQLR